MCCSSESCEHSGECYCGGSPLAILVWILLWTLLWIRRLMIALENPLVLWKLWWILEYSCQCSCVNGKRHVLKTLCSNQLFHSRRRSGRKSLCNPRTRGILLCQGFYWQRGNNTTTTIAAATTTTITNNIWHRRCRTYHIAPTCTKAVISVQISKACIKYGTMTSLG